MISYDLSFSIRLEKKEKKVLIVREIIENLLHLNQLL